MVMTRTHAKMSHRSVGSNNILETDRRTDTTDRFALPDNVIDKMVSVSRVLVYPRVLYRSGNFFSHNRIDSKHLPLKFVTC